MKRQAMVEYQDATPEVKKLYDEGMRTLGIERVPNWMKALGSNANILRSNWEKFRYTVLEGDIPPVLKQLILFNISVKSQNTYCTAVHAYSAMSMDEALTCTKLQQLSDNGSYAGLPESFRVAIDVITELAVTPQNTARDSHERIQALQDEGFSESEIAELIAQADFGVMMNIITAINDIPPEKPYPPPN